MEYNSKEETWKKLIQEMYDSGKPQKKWCEEKGINFHTLKYWMRKPSSKAKPKVEQVANKETNWVKVAVTPIPDLITKDTDKIEVCMGNCRIVVPENFNKESLTYVFEVLAKIC